MRNLPKFDSLRRELLGDPDVKAEYDKLEPEFQLLRAITEARMERKMSQKMLAKKVKTSQAKISLLESGLANPTIGTVHKIAQAFGKKLQIKFV